MEAHTITAALQEHPQRPFEYKPYCYLQMTARFLGEQPSFLRTPVRVTGRHAHPRRPARAHVPGAGRHTPGWLSPDQRHVAFLAASEAFNCTNCAGHAVRFGDMFRGRNPSQVARGGVSSRRKCGKIETTVRSLAVAAVQKPETGAAL